MTFRYVHSRREILPELSQRVALSFFLFSCFLVLTLFFSDDYELSLLSYLTGLLALLAVFRLGDQEPLAGLLSRYSSHTVAFCWRMNRCGAKTPAVGTSVRGAAIITRSPGSPP